jgi:hypothetical protein
LVTETMPILWIVEQSIRDLYVFSVISLRSAPIALLLTVLFPAGVIVYSYAKPQGHNDPMSVRTALVLLVLIPLTTALAMLATIAPYRYAIGYYPDGRVLITTRYFLVLGMALWGTVLGLLLQLLIRMSQRGKEGVSAGLIGLSLLLLAFMSFNALHAPEPPIEELRQYAQAWDNRDRALMTAARNGELETSAASLTHMGGLDELTRNPDDWVNRCIAWTYGLDRVIAK